MQLTVKGKQMDVGDALRQYVQESLDTIVGKYFNKPIEATVVFSREAHLYKSQISVHVGRGILLQGQAEAGEPYPAFDGAAERIAKRLRRHKRRLKDHKNTEGGNGELPPQLKARYTILPAEMGPEAEEDDDHAEAMVPSPQPQQAGDTEDDHKPLVIAEMPTHIASMTVSEAVMRMDLADLSAILFHNKAHGRLNMVYRRSDGNLGWIDPQEGDNPAE